MASKKRSKRKTNQPAQARWRDRWKAGTALKFRKMRRRMGLFVLEADALRRALTLRGLKA